MEIGIEAVLNSRLKIPKRIDLLQLPDLFWRHSRLRRKHDARCRIWMLLEIHPDHRVYDLLLDFLPDIGGIGNHDRLLDRKVLCMYTITYPGRTGCRSFLTCNARPIDC